MGEEIKQYKKNYQDFLKQLNPDEFRTKEDLLQCLIEGLN